VATTRRVELGVVILLASRVLTASPEDAFTDSATLERSTSWLMVQHS